MQLLLPSLPRLCRAECPLRGQREQRCPDPRETRAASCDGTPRRAPAGKPWNLQTPRRCRYFMFDSVLDRGVIPRRLGTGAVVSILGHAALLSVALLVR